MIIQMGLFFYDSAVSLWLHMFGCSLGLVKSSRHQTIFSFPMLHFLFNLTNAQPVFRPKSTKIKRALLCPSMMPWNSFAFADSIPTFPFPSSCPTCYFQGPTEGHLAPSKLPLPAVPQAGSFRTPLSSNREYV